MKYRVLDHTFMGRIVLRSDNAYFRASSTPTKYGIDWAFGIIKSDFEVELGIELEDDKVQAYFEENYPEYFI